MKYKVFTEEDFKQLQQSDAIKEFFAQDFNVNRVQNFYAVFLDELSKITIISEDVSNYQSVTTAELMLMCQELWDSMVPVDIEHKVLMNGWKSFNEVFLKTSIEKKHKDLYNAYLYTDTESVIEYKNRDCYTSADEERYSKLLHIFVDNFGFSDPKMTYQFFHSWFKIVKRGFTTNEENRNLVMLLISKTNRTGKSRLSEFIAQGISEYMHTPLTHSTTQRLISRFNHLPKTNGVIILNECTKQPYIYSSTLKDILGNESQELEYKGVSNRVNTNNHNVFVGSANEFIHLEGMEDTRYLNIPLDYLKYNVHGFHNYGKQIINIVKEILAAAPETDCDESKNIIDELHTWNNKKGDDIEWLRDLYLAVDGDVTALKKQLVDFEMKPLTGKKAIAAKIAHIVNVYNGGVMTNKGISGLAYKIAKYDDIFTCKSMRYEIADDIFTNIEFDDDQNEKEISRPWSESPICRYYSQQPQPSQPQPSQPQPSQPSQIQPVSMNFEFDFEWTDPDAPADVKYEPVSFCDLFLYRPVENENDNKEENNKEENNNLSSSSTSTPTPTNAELSWDLSTIEYLEKLKCPWKK